MLLLIVQFMDGDDLDCKVDGIGGFGRRDGNGGSGSRCGGCNGRDMLTESDTTPSRR